VDPFNLVSEKLKSVFKNLAPVVFCLGVLSGCSKEHLGGSLTVQFAGSGTYEIYKLANEQPLQFVSESSSHFNERIPLSPGSYMVLADCSSEIVNIYPGSDVTLVAHQVNFIPLQPPSERDKFSIQCQRSEKTRNRQSLTNRYTLSVLTGMRDLLVGMVPMRIDLTSSGAANGAASSRVVSYVLSSISIPETHQNSANQFFVSPIGGVTPYTENQMPGAKLFVLKGKYEVQLNGTKLSLELAEGESRNILPGTLRISTSANADIARAEQVRGAPLFAEINGEHYLNLNTTYPVLPGKIDVRLATSVRARPFDIVEGQNLNIHARNVQVDLGCSENDWACLGSRKIRLFEKDKNYHFAEGQTDAPILFFESDVAIGVEGSRNIKMNLSSADDIKLKVGFIEVIPTPIHKPGILTDLMRVEPSGGGMTGASLDMTLDKSTVMPLIAGHYSLSQYTFFTSDGSRRKTAQSVVITAGQKSKFEVQTFLSEKRMSAINAENQETIRQ
jgi:hypothetical protein